MSLARFLVVACLMGTIPAARAAKKVRLQTLEQIQLEAGGHRYDVQLKWTAPYNYAATLYLIVKEGDGPAHYYRMDRHSMDAGMNAWRPYVYSLKILGETFLRIRLVHRAIGNIQQELLLVRMHPTKAPLPLLEAHANLSAYDGNRCNFDRQARLGIVRAGATLEQSVLGVVIGPHPEMDHRPPRCPSTEDVHNNSQTTVTKLYFKDGCFQDEYVLKKIERPASYELRAFTYACQRSLDPNVTSRLDIEDLFLPVDIVEYGENIRTPRTVNKIEAQNK